MARCPATSRPSFPPGRSPGCVGAGFTGSNILPYVQTHTRSASLKERKEQLSLSNEDVKNVQAAKRILSELGSEETVGDVL